MKIVAISDVHGRNFAELIPNCDTLIIAGDILRDFGYRGINLQEQWFLGNFLSELERVNAKYKIFIAGNHDFYFENLFKNDMEDKMRSLLPKNVYYLRDNSIVLDGIKFHGTPWVTHLRNWAFNIPNGSEQKYFDTYYSKIDNDVDLLISHYPPYGYGDSILEFNETENLGNKMLMKAINQKKVKRVVFGHIHSGNHNKMIHSYVGYGGDDAFISEMYNVSLLNESYNIHYNPLILNIEKHKE